MATFKEIKALQDRLKEIKKNIRTLKKEEDEIIEDIPSVEEALAHIMDLLDEQIEVLEDMDMNRINEGADGDDEDFDFDADDDPF